MVKVPLTSHVACQLAEQCVRAMFGPSAERTRANLREFQHESDVPQVASLQQLERNTIRYAIECGPTWLWNTAEWFAYDR